MKYQNLWVWSTVSKQNVNLIVKRLGTQDKNSFF